jgi:hypothetical protein
VIELLNEGLGNILNDAAETINGSGGDDFVDGIAHFAKKGKTDDEKAKIDETSEDFKAAGKIVKGGIKWGTLVLALAVGVKYLVKK